MDCTYKTNGFDLPLFNIVGVSGMNSTLHVAQVFLRGETEVDYDWALTKLKEMLTNRQIGLPKVFIVDRSLALLNSLERIFPSIPVLLCIWHIMKDVEAHIRIRTFPKELDPERSGPRSPKLRDSAKHREFCDAFVALLYSPTQQIYEIRHEKLKMLSAVETVYVDDVWLDIWRRQIVRCWTNKVMHYGMQTSRVEGYHSTLKQWLNSSTGDLLTLHTRMVQWWQSSLAKYRTAVSDAQVKTKNLLRQALFAKVVRVIHDHALLLCLDELNIISQSPCSGEYARVMGLPCSHKLWSLVRSNGFLKPDDFDAHWWIDRSAAPVSEHQVILDPIRI